MEQRTAEDKVKFALGMVAIFFIFALIGSQCSGDTKSTHSSSPRIGKISITKSGHFASFQEEDVRKIYRYAIDEDYEALYQLKRQARIYDLPPNKEVYVLKMGRGKAKIRFVGTTQEAWVLPQSLK